MDDASPENITALVDKANQLIDAERDRINDLAKELALYRKIMFSQRERDLKRAFYLN